MPATLLPTPAQPAAVPLNPLVALWRWLLTGLRLSAQRRQLLELDDHLLADIGLDRSSVRAEAERPFWDLPRAG